MVRPSIPHPLPRSLAGCPIRTVPVSRRPGYRQSRGESGVQRAQAPGGSATHIAPRPSGAPRRPSRPPARKSGAGSATRRGLFASRYLFVQRHLNKTERKDSVARQPWATAVTGGCVRSWNRSTRCLIDAVRTRPPSTNSPPCGGACRRCKVLGDTLKKLFSPTLEKALTFLDDKLLPSTSNAVERGNRRYRKMQKSVYRVRTQAQIRARLALDMWREAQAEGRQHTLASLHKMCTGWINPVALLQSRLLRQIFAHLTVLK